MRQSSAGPTGTTAHHAGAAVPAPDRTIAASMQRGQPSRYRADGEVGSRSGGASIDWGMVLLAVLLVGIVTVLRAVLRGGL